MVPPPVSSRRSPVGSSQTYTLPILFHDSTRPCASGSAPCTRSCLPSARLSPVERFHTSKLSKPHDSTAPPGSSTASLSHCGEWSSTRTLPVATFTKCNRPPPPKVNTPPSESSLTRETPILSL